MKGKAKNKPQKVEIFDTTLRDGSQQSGISFSTHDKLRIIQLLDNLGVDYIEAGWPGASEKDTEVFQTARKLTLEKAKLVAFGMTCSKNKKPEDDKGLKSLLDAETPIIAIVGKASKSQVENILGVSLKENLRMITETVQFLCYNDREVFFDAEHFFDGFKEDPEYAVDCLSTATNDGASRLILCDTKGSMKPWEVAEIFKKVLAYPKLVPLGIHTHNDGEMAVANSLTAIEAGAVQVQVTINGYGERCGNANLCSVLPNLALKMGFSFTAAGRLSQLTSLARSVAGIANITLIPSQAFVGRNAFYHKAGLHVNAVVKDPASYNHINPERVGNISHIGVSELSGKSNIIIRAKEFGIELSQNQIKTVLEKIVRKEAKGFLFEGADTSLKLIMMNATDDYERPFQILLRDINSQQRGDKKAVDSAIIKVMIGNSIFHCVADGDGPVNAMDLSFRKCLLPVFPFLENLRLEDFKVRTLSADKGTAKPVRVLITFSYCGEELVTVGCSTDIIEASLQALADGFEYAIVSHMN